MLKIIANWVLNAISLTIVSNIIPGIRLENFSSALVAVVFISLVNSLIKPIFILLTLPITLLTLGLFTLIINAIMLLIAGKLSPGFAVDGFMSAFLGSIVLSLVSTILQNLTK